MARPIRNKVDYFPHPVTHGKKMSYLEKKYGNDGYATWFKILEELGNTDYHYLDLSDDVQIMFLSDRCLINEEVLINIIDDLVRLREFDKELWNNNRIIYDEKFTESIKDAYKKRSNSCVDKKSLLILLDGLGVSIPNKSNRKPNKSNSEGVENPQRIVKDSKEEETKEKVKQRKLKFASTLEPFVATYGRDLINDFYKYWTEPNKSQTKFRQELEKTWSLERRLETWARNDKNFGKSKTPLNNQKSFSTNR